MKKIDIDQSIMAWSIDQAIAQMDTWTLRKIGRQAGLKMFRELIKEATDSHKESILQQCYMLELKIIKTCQDRDQDAWDVLNAEQKELFAQIKTPQKEAA